MFSSFTVRQNPPWEAANDTPDQKTNIQDAKLERCQVQFALGRWKNVGGQAILETNADYANCTSYGFKIGPEKFKNVEFETALEHTGFGKYNLILILICGLTLFGVNSEAYAIGYVLPSAECDLELNTYTKGILTSTNFIGIMGSCCIWGYLSDTRGRKSVLIISLILGFLCSVAASLTPSFWGFAILRFCNGIFIAGPSAIVYAYFGEFQSRVYRSAGMAWISLFIALALISLPGLGWALLPQKIHLDFLGLSLNSWRLYMLIISIPNLIAALAFVRLPESPKYLYHNGNIQDSLRVLQKIYSINTGKSEESFPVETLHEKVLFEVDNVKKKNILKDFWKQIAPLFMPPHLKYTLASGIMQGGAFAVSSGVLLWYPDIINQLSNSAKGNISETVCQALSSSKLENDEFVQCSEEIDDEVFIQNLIIGAAYLVCYMAWGFVVNFIGNRNFFGYGFFNILILLATGGCLMCVIIETMCMMFIIPAAQCDLNLSLSSKGLLSSVSFIGVVVSSYMWGYLADTRGRKNILVVSLTVGSLTTIICSLVPWDWLFIVLRFINGFFIGGASSVVYAYAGEFHDNRYRPKVISWMSTFVAFGNMFLPGLAWLILPEQWRIDIPLLSIVFRPWRLLLIIYTVPSLLCAFCLYCLPESPKYLLTQGKRKEALDILKKMYVLNSRKDEASYEVKEITWEELGDDNIKKQHGMFKTMWKQTVPLFRGELLVKTLMMSFLQFGIFAS
ncbi:Sugar tr and/or MFS 1 domain containing protein [Asbolus verrucosus]|uniref:Sugar tr and/or MFS 1 domain containing protein n=1 Tax=Asbolus verrucosus TaxID=1661398 RepID=A0A482VMG1_ASBVE|nr:Sugar tr and/or MFS 1 domain containing protein [Asbolus verrucosus]